MKNKYSLLLACSFLLTLFACKKENNYPIIGKWQETKIRVYVTDPTGAIVSDTTYSGNTFTNLDYIQFNSNGTGIQSEDHIYYPVGPAYIKVPSYYLSTAAFNYVLSGSNYTLTSNIKNSNPQNIGLPGSSGSVTATISNSNSLLIHNVDSFTIPVISTMVYDYYFTR